MSKNSLDMLLLTDEDQMQIAKDMEILDRVHSAFVNDGYVDVGQVKGRIDIKDLLTTEDIQRFVPQVVVRVLHEAREPLLMISTLFDTIRMERGQRIEIGAIGAVSVSEIPENGEYKPIDIQMDSGTMLGLSVKKYGCMLQFTEEVIEDSQWDVVGLWIRAAGRAFARNREKRASLMLVQMGEVVFDNADASTTGAFVGGTTGRNITGAANGSMTANDLFDMFAFLSQRGFTPDTIVMHPLAWAMWATDPELKEIVLLNGQLTSRQLWQGSNDPGWPTEHGGMGRRTKGTGLGLGSTDPNYPPATSTSYKIGSFSGTRQLSTLGATFQSQPTFLPRPLNVLVTPFLPFSNSTKVGSTTGLSATTVVVLDSSAIGAFIEKTPLGMDEFKDPMRDTRNMKLRERWGLAIYEQGKGLAIAKNVIVAKNYVFTNTNSGSSMAEINQRTSLVS